MHALTPRTHVVVIDHNPDIRVLFQDFLSEGSYRVTTLAESLGPDALYALAPDVVLHDFTPETAENDLRALQCLLEDPRTAAIPLVLCSASIDVDRLPTVLRAPRVRVVRKPFDLDDILAVIGPQAPTALPALGGVAD
jgi:CheY-like chemotaxis protein